MFLTALLQGPPHPPRAGQACVRKITYAPIIYMALCVVILMKQVQYEGEWALELWAPNCTRLAARAMSRGPHMSRVPGPTPPHTILTRIRITMHGAV